MQTIITDSERLEAIRAVLARFDWETGDRQYALEEIERIAGAPDDGEDQAVDGEDGEDDFEPYCARCGASIGIFIGHGDAWLHYAGEGTADSPVDLYDAGHEPDVAWRPAGAR